MSTNLDRRTREATPLRGEIQGSGTGAGLRGFRDALTPSSLACLIAFAIAAVYLVVLSVQLSEIVNTLTWNSDVASVFTIPESLVRVGSGGHTVLSSTGNYVSLWFGLATAWLPLHRDLWEFAAAGVLLVAALVIGWSVSQLAGRRAGTLAVLLTLVLTPSAIIIFMGAFTHNSAYLATAVLGAYVVWLVRAKADKGRRVIVFGLPILAGVLLGTFLASDLLVLVTGIVPLAFAAALGALQRDRHARVFAASAFTTIALAIPAALLTSAIMGSLGFVVERPSTNTVPLSSLPLHAEYLFEGLKGLFGGSLVDEPGAGALRDVLGIAADVVMIAALLLLLVLGAYTVMKLIRARWRNRDEQVSRREMSTRLHIVYWTGSAVCATVAFEVSVNGSGPRPQYYATLIFAVAAVAPLLMRLTRIGSWLVPIAASILFAASLVGLTDATWGPTPFGRDEPAITRLAEYSHATTGYAGYWYASDLTWNSGERLAVRPVSLCRGGADFCPFYIERVPAWYKPATRRTFLLVNPKEGYLNLPPPGLGPPLAMYELPDSTTMYVYSYDIASRLRPALD